MLTFIVYLFSFLFHFKNKMRLLLRTVVKTPRPSWTMRRLYSSDIQASAMVYAEYGQPSQVLK